jgi:hypothetical protein
VLDRAADSPQIKGVQGYPMTNNEPQPAALYHYTDAAGLIGIIKPSF